MLTGQVTTREAGAPIKPYSIVKLNDDGQVVPTAAQPARRTTSSPFS